MRTVCVSSLYHWVPCMMIYEITPYVNSPHFKYSLSRLGHKQPEEKNLLLLHMENHCLCEIMKEFECYGHFNLEGRVTRGKRPQMLLWGLYTPAPAGQVQGRLGWDGKSYKLLYVYVACFPDGTLWDISLATDIPWQTEVERKGSGMAAQRVKVAKAVMSPLDSPWYGS